MVDIEGRRLNLLCLGAGSPTVIFESGATLAGWDWVLVHAAVAKSTRACVYDRAGLGFSDPSPNPGNSAGAVSDLRKVIDAASLAPPFVLVGHSYGAMNVQLFAYTYPELVSGLVLVDAHHEDELTRLDRITGGKASKMRAEFSEGYKQCTEAARSGFPPGSQQFAACINRAPAEFGREVYTAYIAQMLTLKYWEAAASEHANLDTESSAQLRKRRRSFGQLPVVSLTRSISPYSPPGKPQSAMVKDVEVENSRMQAEITGLSINGTNRVVANAGHSIHVDQPQSVIEAIREVLRKVPN